VKIKVGRTFLHVESDSSDVTGKWHGGKTGNSRPVVDTGEIGNIIIFKFHKIV